MADKISILKSKPSLSNIQNIYDGYDAKIKNYKSQLNQIVSNKLIILDKDLNNYENLIEAFNPNNLLSKGYSIVFKDNKIINSIQNINLDDNLTIKMSDGLVKVEVKEE